jgi:adenylosuccinate synthase
MHTKKEGGREVKRGKLNIVFGGNVGSEAKGKQAAYLADKHSINVFASSMSPNAGHTAIVEGKKWVTHCVPVGVAGRTVRGGMNRVRVYLGPASVINPSVLEEDVATLNAMGVLSSNVFLDARAAVIRPEHVSRENETMLKIGSTGQGVGEARIEKLMRRGNLVKNYDRALPCVVVDGVTGIVRGEMEAGEAVLYEMGQGFDLCIDHGIDPIYCTSRNVTPMMALAEMGIPAKDLGDTYAVIRTFPIRVNNREGSSGPYPSQELDWDAIRSYCGAPEDITEYTTTTKLKRRVFGLSPVRLYDMVRACDPTHICLQFLNYVDWWGCYGGHNGFDLSEKCRQFVEMVEQVTGKPASYLGTGPEHVHMIDRGMDELS